MAIKRTGKMGRSNIKIYCRLIIAASLFFSLVSIFAASDNELQNAEMRKFTVPKFNEETQKLEYILTGKDGKTEGAFIRISKARLEIIGGDGKTIQVVITTPVALYDIVTGFVKGDKDIHYRSLAMDVDGVGFEANQKNQTIKIYNDVKIVIYQKDDPSRMQNKNISEFEKKAETDTDRKILHVDKNQDGNVQKINSPHLIHNS